MALILIMDDAGFTCCMLREALLAEDELHQIVQQMLGCPRKSAA